MKNATKQHLAAIAFILAIGLLPLVFSTSCEDQGPTEETTTDTCIIADVLIQPKEVYTSVGGSQIKFTAAAYDAEGRRIDPSPHFSYTCNSYGVRFNASNQNAWLTPIVSSPSAIEVRAKCYDCEGVAHSAKAEVWIANPTN